MVAEYSLVLIAVGFVADLLAKSQRVRHYGIALMGLGLLFFGMDLMGNATVPLKTYEPFIRTMQEMRSPLLGILAGLCFTAIVQSSSATTGVVIVLGTQGFIPLEAGIALILGANVGTCVTAVLSAIGTPREAVKAAAIHVVFNLSGALLLVWFVPQFADLVRAVSPSEPALSGAARLAAEVPRQIANAHTIFNIGSTLVLLGLAGPLASLVERAVPRARAEPPREGRPIFLDTVYLDQPAVALDRVKLELQRLAEMTKRMVEVALGAALKGCDSDLASLRRRDVDVDELHGSILTYLGQLSMRDLVEPLPRRIQEYLGVANYLENVGDAVETGFVQLGYRRIEAGVEFRPHMTQHIERLGGEAFETYAKATTAFAEGNLQAARDVLDSKSAFNRISTDARGRIAGLITEGSAKGLATYRLCGKQVDGLNRIHTLARRIAAAMLHAHQ